MKTTAAEILELHTLGGGWRLYQAGCHQYGALPDGWTIAGPRKGSGFEYNDKMHDKGQKIVLGHVIAAGGGMNDGLEVLQIVARHSATAHFISLRLAQRFVADDPPPSLVQSHGTNVCRQRWRFTEGNGNHARFRRILVARGLPGQGKTPFEMVVSAIRATNATVTSAYLLTNTLQQLGEPLIASWSRPAIPHLMPSG